MIKHKIQTTKERYYNAIYSSFLFVFNEHIHLGPNQSFRGVLGVWKRGWTFRVLGQWFQMGRPNAYTLLSPNVE